MFPESMLIGLFYNGVRRIVALCAAILSMGVVCSFAAYRTAVFHSDIRSLQVLVDGDGLAVPVVELDGSEVLSVEFDELSYVNSQFYYRIVHCNADWETSDLSGMEYLDGFDGGVIDDYEYSVNTTVNYIHYSLVLPNEDVRVMRSGNYAVIVARDGDFDDGVVATACFSVVEPLARLDAGVSGATMVELNGGYQQLSVKADVSEVGSTSVMTDFVLVVRQNDRRDTEQLLTAPTFLNGSVAEYSNRRELVFEGGNQYRSVDFSSRYTYGGGIDRIEYADDGYHVVLESMSSRAGMSVADNRDVFGGFVINVQGSEYDATEADYMWVHFYYEADVPYLDGELCLLGGMTSSVPEGGCVLRYDSEARAYRGMLRLKQGGYNFVFGLRTADGKLSLKTTEGLSWRTQNRYDLYLYYRPFGARYDRLVSYSSVTSF